MGRSAHFTDQHFIAAAQATIADDGLAGLSIQKIATRVGATSGSVYHRFESLDIIAATAWLAAAEAFQRDFAETVGSAPGRNLYAIVEAGALHTPNWSRKHLVPARVLLRLDASELKTGPLPPDLRARARQLERGLRSVFISLAQKINPDRRGERLQLLRFLLTDMPLAAVKPHLKKNKKPPVFVDAMIRASVQAFVKELRESSP
ncbi:MAG: TetR/AcrR family transcriptional regulator [Leptospirales bacterium]|jgi:AcrR family transcriptional regulator